MRWGLLSLRLVTIAVYIFIIGIILMSLLPLMQGNISVDIPESNTGPTFSDGVLTISQPIEISNGGYFDIQDLSVSLLMADNGMVISDQRSVPQDVPAGKTSTINVKFDVNVNDLSDEAKNQLVFNATNLDVSIGVHAAYTLGLVKLDARGSQTILNEPLISNINIDPNAISLFPNGASEILVPYSFSAAPFIQGQDLNVSAKVTNSTAIIGNGTQHLAIAELNSGQIVLTLDQEAAAWLATHSEELIFSVTFEMFGASLTNDYHYSWKVVEAV